MAGLPVPKSHTDILTQTTRSQADLQPLLHQGPIKSGKPFRIGSTLESAADAKSNALSDWQRWPRGPVGGYWRIGQFRRYVPAPIIRP
ncbi:unnamed protein product, partial [Iphiclides podalirius]